LIDKLIITHLCAIYLIEKCQLVFFILFFYGSVRLAVGLLVFSQEIKRKEENENQDVKEKRKMCTLKKRGKENQAGTLNSK